MALSNVSDIGAAPPPRPRNGLKAGGKRLWLAVVNDYDLDGQGLELLAQACRTVDVIATLDAVVAAEGAMSESTQGARVHPAIVEARQQRSALRQLVTALGLDRASVVSHDIGIMVAYAYAARYPDKVERLVDLEQDDVDPAASAMVRSNQARAAARARHGSGGFGGAASRRAVS